MFDEQPLISDTQRTFLMDRTVPGELRSVELSDDAFDLALEGAEVAAVQLLARMHGKVVLLRDPYRDWPQVGVLRIAELNGERQVDAAAIGEASSVNVESISIEFASVNAWGESKSTYSSPLQIARVARLREQPEA